MNTRSRLLVIVALVALTGCGLFGKKARDEALLPALRASAIGLQSDADAGVAQLPPEGVADGASQVDAFFLALRSDPVPEDILTLWLPVAGYCELGFVARVEAGSIGPGVAASLRERVERFSEGLAKYAGGTNGS